MKSNLRQKVAQKLREKKKFWIVLVGSLTALALLLIGLQWQFALEIEGFKTRFGLWRAGVHSRTTLAKPALHYWERDLCHGMTGTAAEPTCQCVLWVHGLGDEGISFRKILSQVTLEPGTPYSVTVPVRMVALDLPWSGESEGWVLGSENAEGKITVRAMARELARRLPELGACPRWTVIGNSLGGWVTMWMAIESTIVNRVGLIGSAGLADVKNRSKMMQPTVESLKEFQRMAYFKPRPIPEAVWEKIAKKAQEKVGSGLGAHLDFSTDVDLRERVSVLRRMTMVIWGEADRVIPVYEGEALARQIPNAAWRLIPQCGHLPQKECPEKLLTLTNELMGFGAY